MNRLAFATGISYHVQPIFYQYSSRTCHLRRFLPGEYLAIGNNRGRVLLYQLRHFTHKNILPARGGRQRREVDLFGIRQVERIILSKPISMHYSHLILFNVACHRKNLGIVVES